MRRREGYHKKQGHRQELTVIRIKEIKLPEAAATA
jgi:ribosomal protein L21